MRSSEEPIGVTHIDAESESTCRKGVLLINLGTPDEPTIPAVRRYLGEFLADPEVIQLPKGFGFLNKPLGKMIARLRAPVSAAMYQKIWNEEGSPLRAIADAQVQSLQEVMPRGWRVLGAMRYGEPSIPRALRRIEQMGVEELIVLPMYPHYSGPTTGTALKAVYDHLAKSAHMIHITTRPCWYDDHGYILAQAQLVKQYAKAHNLTPDNTFLLFSTHGMPVSYIRKGDPYPEQVATSVGLVGEQLGWANDRMSLAYQSRFGPAKWLQPFTDEVLADLVAGGEKRILVCPISFTTDCLETLEEIDLRYREILEKGGADLYLTPALNTYEPFIKALKDISIRGSRPIRIPVKPLRTFTSALPNHTSASYIESLVMVGMSVPGKVHCQQEANWKPCTASELRSVKRSALEVPALLRDLLTDASLTEALLWNTCHRFECYGVIPIEADSSTRTAILVKMKQKLFEGRDVEPTSINLLTGSDAWAHLLRTAAGLNSTLPGERDILEQLHGALRLADRAGAVGSVLRKMVREVDVLEQRLRTETAWSNYQPDYTHVALTHLRDQANLDLQQCRIVVIGGSTTSVSVLHTLRNKFGVTDTQLTLLYRGHKNGGHLKLLRKAVGGGHRMRVQSYDEDVVLQSIAQADVCIFGVDRQEPILNREQLESLRDWSARPLTVVDFNTFASSKGLDELEGINIITLDQLEMAVNHYAETISSQEVFQQAYDEAIEWIERSSQKEGDVEMAPLLLAEASAPVATQMKSNMQAKQVEEKLSSEVTQEWPR